MIRCWTLSRYRWRERICWFLPYWFWTWCRWPFWCVNAPNAGTERRWNINQWVCYLKMSAYDPIIWKTLCILYDSGGGRVQWFAVSQQRGRNRFRGKYCFFAKRGHSPFDRYIEITKLFSFCFVLFFEISKCCAWLGTVCCMFWAQLPSALPIKCLEMSCVTSNGYCFVLRLSVSVQDVCTFLLPFLSIPFFWRCVLELSLSDTVPMSSNLCESVVNDQICWDSTLCPETLCWRSTYWFVVYS